jgi:hypothetical protein
MRFFIGLTLRGFALTASLGNHEIAISSTWETWEYVDEAGYATLTVGPLFLGWPTRDKRQLGLGEY